MSTTIGALTLENWKCFAGKQRLELRPTHYAVCARHERDPERSNWLGKSSIMEAVDYALTGRLPRSCRRKVDWITRGEKMGAVEIEMSDGARVRRSLSLTTSEKVWYYGPGVSPEGATMQGEADLDIERAMGLTADDLIATCYFRQKDMSRLLVLDPSERMKMIAGWLRLEGLQRCEAAAGKALAKLADEAEGCRTKIREADTAFEEGFKRAGARDVADLELKIVEAIGETEKARKSLEDAMARDRAIAERDQVRRQADRYDAIVEEGKELAAKVAQSSRVTLEAEVQAATARHGETAEKLGVARKQYRERHEIAQGRFDGACPLMGKACPAGDAVVRELKENRRALELVGMEAQSADQVHAGSVKELQDAREALRLHDRDDVRLRDLREEGRRLKPSKEKLAKLPEDDAVVASSNVVHARDAWEDASTFEQQLKAIRSLLQDKERQRQAAREKLDQIERAMRIASAAVAIFGKNGAQRVIAEDALVEIEARACDLLRTCGIDLSVKIEWSREGTGLAATCGACGAAFPKSEKVKRCARCGTERGPNLVNKLEIVPSDVSGAAEDLAGASVQLAASAWLREDRDSRWGVAMLDEPVGAMDAAIRRMFAGKLPVMLGQVGFGQSFVIAHHSSVLDALPGRIEVVSDGRRSVARVVA